MSIRKFWHEINKFDHEVHVIREVANAQWVNEFLSGEEKEKAAEDAVREMLKLHDEHIAWLYEDTIKSKFLNVALSVAVGVMGFKLLKRN